MLKGLTFNTHPPVQLVRPSRIFRVSRLVDASFLRAWATVSPLVNESFNTGLVRPLVNNYGQMRILLRFGEADPVIAGRVPSLNLVPDGVSVDDVKNAILVGSHDFINTMPM